VNGVYRDSSSEIPEAGVPFYAKIRDMNDHLKWMDVTITLNGNNFEIDKIHRSTSVSGMFDKPIVPVGMSPNLEIFSILPTWRVIEGYREGYDVIGCLGQSNQAGRGEEPGIPSVQSDPVLPEGRIFEMAWDSEYSSTGEIVEANPNGELHAVESVYYGNPDNHLNGPSPCYTFAQEYLKYTNYRRPVLLAIIAQGSTGLTGHHSGAGGFWNPTGGPLYLRAINGLQAALDSDPDNKYGATLWVQGETDSYNLSLAPGAYLERYLTLINGVLGSLSTPIQSKGDILSTPWVSIGFVPEWWTGGSTKNVAVLNDLRNAQNSRSYLAHLDTNIDDTYIDLTAGIQPAPTPANIHWSKLGSAITGRDAGRLIPFAANNVQEDARPGAVSSLLAEVTAQQEITLSWAPIGATPSVTHYEVNWWPEGSTAVIRTSTDPEEALSQMIFNSQQGIGDNTVYNFQIRAINSLGAGTWSAVTSVNTGSLPVPNTITAVDAQTSAQIAVSWPLANAVPPLFDNQQSGIRVQFRDGSATDWLAATTIGVPDNAYAGKSYTISTGVDGIYDVRVGFTNIIGGPVWSNTVEDITTTTQAVPPSGLSLFSPSGIGENGFTVNWNGDVVAGTPPIVYGIEVRPASGVYTTVVSNLAYGTTSYNIDSLVPETTYDVRVTASGSTTIQVETLGYATTAGAPVSGGVWTGVVDQIAANTDANASVAVEPTMYFVLHPDNVVEVEDTTTGPGLVLSVLNSNNDLGLLKTTPTASNTEYAAALDQTAGNRGMYVGSLRDRDRSFTFGELPGGVAPIGSNGTLFIRYKANVAGSGYLFASDVYNSGGPGMRLMTSGPILQFLADTTDISGPNTPPANDFAWRVVAVDCNGSSATMHYATWSSTVEDTSSNCDISPGIIRVGLQRWTSSTWRGQFTNGSARVSHIYSYNVNLSEARKEAIFNELLNWDESAIWSNP
jgi:hypothetical protein